MASEHRLSGTAIAARTPPIHSRATLRTKVGCLTCRRRRLKCGEERPCCSRCFNTSNACEWPGRKDLVDRRHRRHCSDANSIAQNGTVMMNVLRNPSLPTTICSSLERHLLTYFLDTFLKIVLLDDLEPQFYIDYQTHIVGLALECGSVKCAVLASAASSIYMFTGDNGARKLALTYYCQALEQVNDNLKNVRASGQGPGDSLLTTVMFLYLNTLWGVDASEDAPIHVTGAIELMKLRYADRSSPLSLSRAFDRVTVESIIYQAFLLCARHPFALDFHVDADYLAGTESIFTSSTTSMDASITANSPVLGAPLPLYRLILDIVQLYNSNTQINADNLSQARTEMRHWETVFNTTERGWEDSLPSRTPHMHVVALWILAASLMLDWISELHKSQPKTDVASAEKTARSRRFRHSPRKKQQWQLAYALGILGLPRIHQYLTQCYLGLWPMLIFGYAAETDEEIAPIQDVLRKTRRRLGYGEMERTLNELEQVWRGKREVMST